MNRQKSFLLCFLEMVEQYRADRWHNSSQESYSQSGHLRRFLSWLTPNGGTLLLIAALILTQNAWARTTPSAANAPGPSATTVNYQGRLADSGGTPLDGSYGMSFALYDALAGGGMVWGPENHTAVPVSEGLFSVGLGSLTGGGIPTSVWDGDRYLEITVGGETLSPRELIRSVPIAGMALTVPDGAISQANAPSLIAGQTDNTQLRWGHAIFNTDAEGKAIITLSHPFSNDIDVVIAENADYRVGGFTVHYQSGGPDWTASSFPVQLYGVNGGIFANRHVQIRYIAIGH